MSAAGSTREAGDSAARILILCALVLLAGITLNVNGATRIFTWPWWGWWRLALLLPLVAVVIQFGRDSNAGLTRTGAWCLGGFLIWYAIAALSGEQIAVSVSYSGSMLAVGAVVWLVANSPTAARRLPGVFASGGIVYCAASLVAWWWWIASPHWRETAALNAEAQAPLFSILPLGPRNSLLLGHWNYTAGIGVLAFPWAVAWAVNGRRWLRLAGVAGSLVVLFTLLTAMSRGAWVGVLASGGVAVLACVIRVRWSWARLLPAALAVGILILSAILLAPRLRTTAVAVVTGRGFTASDVQRMNMAQVGAMMVQDHPAFGSGPGLTPTLYPVYRHRVDAGVETAFQLHSTPLQLAVDAGLGALVLALALGAHAAWRVGQGWRRGEPVFSSRGVAGIALAGYGVYALTDYQLDVPVIAAGVAAMLGLTLQRTSEDAPTSPVRLPRVVVLGVGGLLVTGLAVLNIREGLARRWLAEGVAHAERTHETGRLDAAAMRAAGLQPGNPHPLVAAAIVHLRWSHHSEAADEVARHRGSALYLLQQALEISPDLEIAHFNLGWLLVQRLPAQAAAHFRRALELVPDRRGVYYGLGLARLETGDHARAIDALALELLHDPQFATSPAWDVAALVELREPALRRAVLLARELGESASVTARPSLEFTAGLFAWLLGDTAALPTAGSPPNAAETLEWINRPPAAVGDFRYDERAPPWRAVVAAAREPGRRDVLIRHMLFVRFRREPTPGELTDLRGVFERAGTDARAWMLAPEGRAAPFAKLYRHHRPAYATLAYNLDIPTPYDEFLVQENGLVTWLFGSILPGKGSVPATAVVAWTRARDL